MFQQHLGLPSKAEALERGSLLHYLLEIYDGLQLDEGPNLGSESWRDLLAAGFTMPEKTIPHYREFAINAGRFFAVKMELSPTEVETTIYQFTEYTKFFEYDGWHVLAVEEVGSRILHEDEDLKIIYNFKIDKVAEKGNLVMPWDYKSSSRRQEVSSLSNQFMGYTWGLGMTAMMVVKIGFQKTLKPAERFERNVLQYSPARLAEWVQNSIFWSRKLGEHIAENHFPMNLTSCDKYSGCIYRAICESDPTSREWTIDKNYKVGKPWDVSVALLEAE